MTQPCLVAVFLTITSFLTAGEKPNVVLICVDDLRPELGCYGVDYISSPHIDALAERSRVFRNHYVQAPTCGASRYALLTGMYGPDSNTALFERSKKLATASPSLPKWFRDHGYTTAAVGKVSHHPGGKGGPDWDDATVLEMPESWDFQKLPSGPWQHPRGWMHGLANGEIRGDAKDMDLFEALEGDDSIYPDGRSVEAMLSTMSDLAESEGPFFLACGILRPHLPFGAPAQYLEPYKEVELPPIPHPEKPTGKTTWHSSGEFMKYNRWGRDPREDAEFATEVRRHYAACVSYADAQVGKILARLDRLGQRENTIIVLWGDHGWHLGEHAIWGKHSLFEESLHAPLLISHPGLEDPGASTSAVVETIDIFPTLTDLAGLPVPDFVDGESLREVLEASETTGGSALSYRKGAKTIRDGTHRLILHKDGFVELYDHSGEGDEAENVAEAHPEVVERLVARLPAQ